MKLYNRLKRMKKSAKVGLVSGAVYTATALAVPAFASQITEKPVVRPLNLDQITSPEQADDVYHTKLKEYAADKKITSDEIHNLNDLLQKKKSVLSDKYNELKGVSNDLFKKTASEIETVEKKIEKVQISISSLNEKERYNPASFEKIKEDLEGKVLCYYPSLIEKEKNLTYSASDIIEEELNPVIKDFIKVADIFLRIQYNDSSLNFLVEKLSYTVKDIVSFYEIINKERPAVEFDEKIVQSKLNLEKELQKLEEEYKILNQKSKEQREEVGIRLDKYKKGIKNIEQMDVFKFYLDAKNSANDFLNRYGNLNKYLGVSLWSIKGDNPVGFLSRAHPEAKRCKFNSQNKKAISSIKHYFNQNLGFDVEVEALKNPAQFMFPWPWWGSMLFGMGFPIVRNIITAQFVRRKMDLWDYVDGCFLEPMFGSLFLDGAFPLLYPIRVFGMPFIVEPIRALTGARDLK